MTNATDPRLTQARQRLGPLVTLNCTRLACASAHHRLGAEAQAQIHKILAGRLADLGGPEQVAAQIRRARGYQAALLERTRRAGLDETLRGALGTYQECLAAWAEGARLTEFRHPQLTGAVDGAPVSAEELAILLQEDEVGCQTGVYRERDGSILLWHAEEDVEAVPGQRFDRLRLFSFRACGGTVATGFIYPDLLPGPTFGWQGRDYVQAIDTLHVRPVEQAEALLPNTLAWLSLYLGNRISRAQLARQLGPFQGGYSLTTASQQAGGVSVEKVEFANGQVAASNLGTAAGEYLFQTNILNDLSLPIGVEELTENRAWNEQRRKRTARLLGVIQRAPEARPLIFRLLRSRLGGDSAYANPDVKAYLVCHLAGGSLSAWVGSGPAGVETPPLWVEPD
jgi:hypothetical protein